MLIALLIALFVAGCLALLVAWIVATADFVERVQEDRARDLAGGELPPPDDAPFWP